MDKKFKPANVRTAKKLADVSQEIHALRNELKTLKKDASDTNKKALVTSDRHEAENIRKKISGTK